MLHFMSTYIIIYVLLVYKSVRKQNWVRFRSELHVKFQCIYRTMISLLYLLYESRLSGKQGRECNQLELIIV